MKSTTEPKIKTQLFSSRKKYFHLLERIQCLDISDATHESRALKEWVLDDWLYLKLKHDTNGVEELFKLLKEKDL